MSKDIDFGDLDFEVIESDMLVRWWEFNAISAPNTISFEEFRRLSRAVYALLYAWDQIMDDEDDENKDA